MNTIFLKNKHHRRIETGHLWIFSNEIDKISGDPASGEVVIIRKADGSLIGTGFFNPHSLIAVRILTYEETPIDADFFRIRLQQAIELRNLVFPVEDVVRLVHSESDLLPGLIVDKFGESLSIQVHSAGTEQFLDTIIDLLDEMLHPEFIVIRNESHLRTLEGLPQYKKIAKGPELIPEITIKEHGILYDINPMEGQKTGFYIDQRDNRLIFRKFVKAGNTVLDAFCNEGGFALNAAASGARSVDAVDVSESVLNRGKQNAKVNGYDHLIEFRQIDLMKSLTDSGLSDDYDVVNLDPPNFAKNKKSVGAAKRAYRNLHEFGIKMLKPGGILVTSCCSHHIFPETFYQTVVDAANLSNRKIRLLHRGGHAPDHPILAGMPETEYLKFLVFQVLS